MLQIDITKIILSESPQKRTDLLNLCINKEREAQQLQQHETINMIRTTIQAIINHLFHSSKAQRPLPTTSPKEKEDQRVPDGTGQEKEKPSFFNIKIKFIFSRVSGQISSRYNPKLYIPIFNFLILIYKVHKNLVDIAASLL